MPRTDLKLIEIDEIEKTEKIDEIANFIKNDWKKINFGAEPYLNAMLEIENIADNYHLEMGDSIVRYFLGNASTYRGENARIVKKRLNKLLEK